MTMATVVDIGALWEAIWTAAVAGIGTSIVFALVVLGATRSADHRREGHRQTALAFALMAAAALAGTVGLIVYAIVLITSK